MKKKTKKFLLITVIVYILYALVIWLSGWQPERGDVAVMLFITGVWLLWPSYVITVWE